MCGCKLYSELDYDRMLRDTQRFIKASLSGLTLPLILRPTLIDAQPNTSPVPFGELYSRCCSSG